MSKRTKPRKSRETGDGFPETPTGTIQVDGKPMRFWMPHGKPTPALATLEQPK